MNIPAPVWVWQSASGLWSGPEEQSGSYLSSDADTRSSPRSQPSSDAGASEGATSPWILLVEDNSGDAALVRQALKDHGVTLPVVLVDNGEKALRYIDKVDAGTAVAPALVILDLNLPRVPGRDVLARIRSSSNCRNVKVAVFSSSYALQDRQDAARLNANRYIQKPSGLDEFLRVGALLRSLIDE